MFEPHTRCKPSGGPCQFITPTGTEIVDDPELGSIYIFDAAGPQTFRVIYMDGREHPKDLESSFYGHSVGHWEGDTLVVDTVNKAGKLMIGNEESLERTSRIAP